MLTVGLSPAWIGPVAAVSVLAATIVATRLTRVTSSRRPSSDALLAQ